MSTLDVVEKFTLVQIAADLGRESLGHDEDLLDLGIIDSLGIIKLIVFLEDTFKIKIDDAEIVPENFQSLNIIAGFVTQKSCM